jgi:ribosomal-protein-alanine N-acetyltransferase
MEKPTMPREKLLQPEDRLVGESVSLRLVTAADCTDRYVSWLQDPQVNRYLETRWRPQSLEAVRGFVADMQKSDANYLMAIVENSSGTHLGNLKVGPIVAPHEMADLSYFIGERGAWGKGYATQAIRLATTFAFRRLGLRRLQAGLYETNLGSKRALEKAGYRYEGRFPKQLRGADGWEDHLWYAALASDWTATT